MRSEPHASGVEFVDALHTRGDDPDANHPRRSARLGGSSAVSDLELEQELLEQARGGDGVAVQRLLLLHHDAVAAYIAPRIPRDLQAALEADDICQEAYASAVRDLTKFESRGEGALRGWLITIAERKLTDAVRLLRAEKRGGGRIAVDAAAIGPSGSLIALLEQFAVQTHTPSRSVIGQELVETVHAALQKLADDQRAAISGRYIEGLSLKQTAERMKRTEGAVLMLCNRALKRLSQILGDSTRFFSARA
jgi:RNA polymerase sigma-70 factor (ECF subfamily)